MAKQRIAVRINLETGNHHVDVDGRDIFIVQEYDQARTIEKMIDVLIKARNRMMQAQRLKPQIDFGAEINEIESILKLAGVEL